MDIRALLESIAESSRPTHRPDEAWAFASKVNHNNTKELLNESIVNESRSSGTRLSSVLDVEKHGAGGHYNFGNEVVLSWNGYNKGLLDMTVVTGGALPRAFGKFAGEQVARGERVGVDSTGEIKKFAPASSGKGHRMQVKDLSPKIKQSADYATKYMGTPERFEEFMITKIKQHVAATDWGTDKKPEGKSAKLSRLPVLPF